MARLENAGKSDTESESSQAGPGHNEGPNDSLILTYARDIIELDEKISDVSEERKSLAGARAARFKSAKLAGIHIAALRRSIHDSKRGPDDVLAEERAYLRMASLFRMPLHQMDLFPPDAAPPLRPDSPEGRKQAVFDASVQGLRAGKAGYLIDDNPYHQVEDNEEHAAWVSNWHSGQAHLARGLTQPRVTGRRAANGNSNPEDAHSAG